MFIGDSDADKPGTHAHILDVCANALAIAGYKILDGDKEGIIIRNVGADAFESDYEIKVNEIP